MAQVHIHVLSRNNSLMQTIYNTGTHDTKVHYVQRGHNYKSVLMTCLAETRGPKDLHSSRTIEKEAKTVFEHHVAALRTSTTDQLRKKAREDPLPLKLYAQSVRTLRTPKTLDPEIVPRKRKEGVLRESSQATSRRHKEVRRPLSKDLSRLQIEPQAPNKTEKKTSSRSPAKSLKDLMRKRSRQRIIS